MFNLSNEHKLAWQEFKRHSDRVVLTDPVRVTSKERRPWLPRRCYLSNKLLWGDTAVKLTRKLDHVTETYWIDKHEYTLFLLKYTE